MATSCEVEGSDVYHRIRLLNAKVLLFARCGRPQKGLSLALRATAAAYRARIVPALWEAVGALAVVIMGIGEFAVAKMLLEAIIWQVRFSCLEPSSGSS